jgi:hypothetical protein
MVGGHDKHYAGWILAGDKRGSETDACRRVSAAWFANNPILGERWDLPGGLRAMIASRYNPRPFGGHLSLDTIVGLLQQRSITAQGQELLGLPLPAPRPKACTAAAGHYQCVKHFLALHAQSCIG